MKKIKNFFKIIRGKKGLTGADVAAAITMIVLTVGIVTAIYVNTINKSKDNVRYSNAVRMATNIIENIQRKPFEYLTAICNTTDSSKTVSTGQIFDTKVPNGFSVTITAKKTADDVDIARDVIVNVKYRANSSYKTITLNTVKQKELMDMTNPPDFSLIPGYKPLDTKNFYYPVKKGDGGKTVVTSTDDINWYDYEDGNYALVCVTSTGTLSVGNEAPSGSKIYVWIPRFVAKVGTGLDNVQFLYGSSKYAITFNQYGNLFQELINI